MSAAEKDCGWGWVIVVAAFVNNFILDGVRYSYGLLYIEFLQEFERGKAETSWIGSLLFGSINMGGIAAGILVNKFGCKAVSISGTLISTVGYIASIFAGNVQYLYVTFGIIGGIGFSLSTLALNVIVMQWFDRRRSLAYGLAACGSGLGGIVFNPLSKWLIDVYGWRDTFLIETAIILNGIACGLVMRPFPGKALAPSRKQIGKTSSSPNNQKCTSDGVKKQDEKSKARSLLGTGGVLDSQLETLKPDKYFRRDKRQEICEESEFLSELELNANRSEKKHKNSKKLFKLDLFTNPGFLIFSLSFFIKSFSYMVPFTYLPDMVVIDGLNRTQAAWLISFIGIANTVCRPFAGWVGDKKWMKRTTTYSLALISSGVCIGLLPFLKTFYCLVIVCLLFGLSIATWLVLFPVLLVDFYGENAVANTIGMQYFFAGIGSLVGPPVAGWMFDAWKRYDIPFTVAGSEFIISGILVLMVPCLPQKFTFSCN